MKKRRSVTPDRRYEPTEPETLRRSASATHAPLDEDKRPIGFLVQCLWRQMRAEKPTGSMTRNVPSGLGPPRTANDRSPSTAIAGTGRTERRAPPASPETALPSVQATWPLAGFHPGRMKPIARDLVPFAPAATLCVVACNRGQCRQPRVGLLVNLGIAVSHRHPRFSQPVSKKASSDLSHLRTHGQRYQTIASALLWINRKEASATNLLRPSVVS